MVNGQRSPELDELVDRDAPLRRIAEGFRFTEGPVWDQRARALLFSDIRSDTRWRWTADEGATVVAHPNRIGNGMVLDRNGDLIVCEHVTSSVVRTTPDGTRDVLAWHVDGHYLNSPNDVVTRSDGLVYFTDPDYGRWDHPVGVPRPRDLEFTGLFRVRPGSGVELAAPSDTFDEPNGLCFSPDETVLYVDDVDGVRAFDVAPDGSLSSPRWLRRDMSGTVDDGAPDGMKCDANGNVWCAARGGVWVIHPGGRLLGVIETPEVVANLTCGGPDLQTVFLCTSTTIHALHTRVPSAPLPYHAITYGLPVQTPTADPTAPTHR